MVRLILLFCLMLIACDEQPKKNNQMSNKIQQEIPEPHIMYGLAFNAYLPFEVYLDDFPIKKWYRNSLNTFIDINPYLLEKGKHTIKIVLLPIKGRQLISPKDMELNKLKLARFEKQYEPGLGRAKNYKDIATYTFPTLTESVPRLELEWKIDISDISFELEGWKNSENLKSLDPEQLKEEVVAYYERLREDLNKGNVDSYMALLEDFYHETDVAEYLSMSESELQKKEIRVELLQETKGKMQDLENYRLAIYGNGKLVTLERIDEKNKGEPVLRATEENGTETFYYVYLHKPNGKEGLKIIR